MAASKQTTTFLRPDYNPQARHHIEDYLNAEYPDWEKVVRDLSLLDEQAEKIIISKYEGQRQVSAFFVGTSDGKSYGVSGLGDTLDLAILSCYVKAALVLEWKFGSSEPDSSSVSKPRFS
jgi:hypothetical protein